MPHVVYRTAVEARINIVTAADHVAFDHDCAAVTLKKSHPGRGDPFQAGRCRGVPHSWPATVPGLGKQIP